MNWRVRLEPFMLRLWQGRSWLACALLPLAWLYGLVLSVRRALYALGLKRQTRLHVPVIVVGNIFVGGTGKTPFVIWLVEQLRAQGWHPGVIARGYGAHLDQVTEVQPDSDTQLVGDEPVLIQQRTAVPVVVGRSRVRAAQQLLRLHPTVDVLISDDGLQHYALARTIEIQLFDLRGNGNGWLLPAGPLREPVTRRADFFVLNAVAAANTAQPSAESMPSKSVTAAAKTEPSQNVSAYRMTLQPEFAYSLSQPAQRRSVSALPKDQRIVAAAGIGNPQRFFEMLRGYGVHLSDAIALPDHFDYAHNPFEAIRADMVLVTEKDAVKCARIHHLANDARLWVVPVTALIAEPLLDHILEMLRGQSTP